MIKDRYDDLTRLAFLFISTFRPFRTCLETTTFRVKGRHRRFLLMNWFMCQPLKLQTSLQSKANIYLNESSPFPRFVHRLRPVSGWCDRTCVRPVPFVHLDPTDVTGVTCWPVCHVSCYRLRMWTRHWRVCFLALQERSYLRWPIW